MYVIVIYLGPNVPMGGSYSPSIPYLGTWTLRETLTTLKTTKL